MLDKYHLTFTFYKTKQIASKPRIISSKLGQISRVTITIQKIFNNHLCRILLRSICQAILSRVSSRAWIAQPQGIPFESLLVFTLGYKLLVLVSSLGLKAGPRLADTWFSSSEKYNFEEMGSAILPCPIALINFLHATWQHLFLSNDKTDLVGGVWSHKRKMFFI